MDTVVHRKEQANKNTLDKPSSKLRWNAAQKGHHRRKTVNGTTAPPGVQSLISTDKTRGHRYQTNAQGRAYLTLEAINSHGLQEELRDSVVEQWW